MNSDRCSVAATRSTVQQTHTSARRFSSKGMMTVPVLPCDQSRMSLFQDLKLKRRKVDSRCSSDGESVADTSTSSPDSGASAIGSSSSPSNHCDITMSPCKHRESPEPIGMCNNSQSLSAVTAPATSLDSISNDQSCSMGDESITCHTICGRESPTASGDEQMNSSSLEMACSPRRKTNDIAPTYSYFLSSPSSTSHSLSTTIIASNEQSLTSDHLDSVAAVPSPIAVSSAAVSYWNEVVHHLNGLRPPMTAVSSSKQPVTENHPEAAFTSSSLSEAAAVTSRQHNRHSHQQQHQHQQRQLQVVMGDHGGVRTMMWTSNSEPSSVCQLPNQALRSTKGKCVSSPTSHLVSNNDRVIKSSVDSVISLDSAQCSLTAPNASSTSQENHSVQSPCRMSPPDSNQPSRAPFHRGSLLQHQLQSRSPTLNAVDYLKDGSVSHGYQQISSSRSVFTSCTSSSPPKSKVPSLIYNKTVNSATSMVSLDMNEFWNQSQALNLTTAGFSNRNSSEASTSAGQQHYDEEEEHPMICMICDDKATGLHYGIITCEGCKGFFKRTVQNKRVYSCVADGNCEITKAQRNRCQFCRFQKCLSMGMVLAAVREDRMPGGRNSGAVYNLYKVKYKKHKKKQLSTGGIAGFGPSPLMFNGNLKMEASSPKRSSDICSTVPAGLLSSGNILKTALTNPTEVDHLRHHMEIVNSPRAFMSFESSSSLIRTLIACDNFEDIATVQNLNEIFDHVSDISEKLCHIGETIVYKLVQWTKQLPFYVELPVPVHTQLLTNKWHELLVLTTCSYQAIKGDTCKQAPVANSNSASDVTDFHHEVSLTMSTLQSCLSTMMNQTVSLEQLTREVGPMIEKITLVTVMLRNLAISMQEYVCLKIIALLGDSVSLHPQCELIEQRYRSCLRVYVSHEHPDQPSRYQELLARLPEVREAATLLLESKMFYVPFLLNSTVNT